MTFLFLWKKIRGGDLNYTEPIRNKRSIEKILRYLKKESDRDYILFLLGFYTGLRIQDILNLKVSDVRGKKYITLNEGKTKKGKRFFLHDELRMELKRYTQGKEEFEYLILSRQGINSPIGRERAYQIIRETGEMFNLEIAPHSLRKTFGYIHYQQHKNIAILQKIFNHSSQLVTLRYIGVEQDVIDDSIKSFSLY